VCIRSFLSLITYRKSILVVKMAANEALDCLRILGLEVQSENDLNSIDEAAIKRAYRKLALKLHPDKNKDDPNAETRFNNLKNAHDKMMNTSVREVYMSSIRAWLQRKQERELRDKDKQRLAADLERREFASSAGTTSSQTGVSFRAQHRAMVEQSRMKRQAQSVSAQARNRTVDVSFPEPDDSNMDINYWIKYGFEEPREVSEERQKEFSKFILEMLG